MKSSIRSGAIAYRAVSAIPVLPGESAPVEDVHFHPVEPRTLRLALTARF
jgi:hypothetical protein